MLYLPWLAAVLGKRPGTGWDGHKWVVALTQHVSLTSPACCVSSPQYYCTKDKGEKQKSRTDCLPECKEKCAVTPDQKMLGVPKKAAGQ